MLIKKEKEIRKNRNKNIFSLNLSLKKRKCINKKLIKKVCDIPKYL